MPANSQKALQPIDDFVFAGFRRRFQQVFGCKCAFINQNDKTKILDTVFGQGHPFSYPYAYFEIQSVSDNVESYNANYLARRGLRVQVDSDGTIQTVRLLPANFELELTYVTNVFRSVDQGSVTAFARRWLLARRMGYLKYSISYGSLNLNISLTLNNTVPIPQRDNITEAETKYEVKVNATINGYVSEPVLGEKGIAKTVNVVDGLGLKQPNATPSGKVVSSTFHEFPNRS